MQNKYTEKKCQQKYYLNSNGLGHKRGGWGNGSNTMAGYCAVLFTDKAYRMSECL